MSRLPNRLRVGVAAAALLLSACTDNPVAVTAPEPVKVIGAMQCTVDVRSAVMTCARVRPPSTGANLDVIFGYQDVVVKLASSGVSYNSGTEILEATVTVQNLLSIPMGTTDSTTVGGVTVFFHSGPTVTGGSGTVSVGNPDGTGTFTNSGQPYFSYNQIVWPLEISDGKQWQFSVQPTVTSFSFLVYLSAAFPSYTGSLADQAQNTWTGTASTVFSADGNWSDGTAPDSGQSITVPADSLLASSNMPQLDSAVFLDHVRVGFASTLNQNNFGLRAAGNVDVLGTLTNGELTMTGAGALLRGNVDAMRVNGSIFLQGATKATGAVNVSDGKLTVSGTNTLTISLP